MEKAFLSHSSIDKDFVRKIAQKLRRFQVEYDENNFEPGEDFRIAIRDSLNICKLFVLFASKSSISSGWVKFEIDEVEYINIKKDGISFLVFLLDDTKHTDLPVWMQRFKVIKALGVNQTVEIIQNSLLDGLHYKNELYIGREIDMQNFSMDITKQMYNFPKCIAITGLEGIGRKCFIEHVLDSYFSLSFGPKIELDETQSIDDLYVRLCSENVDNFTTSELEKTIKVFKEVSYSEKISEIVRMLATFICNHAVPVIVDNGALLNDDGNYKKEYEDIIREFKFISSDTYLVIIHKRYPQLTYEQLKENLIYIYSLKNLDHDSTKRLFHNMLAVNNVKNVTNIHIEEISDYLGGYPPAIERAVVIAKRYGIDALYNDKGLLSDFKMRAFTQYIKTLKLNDYTQDLLKALNNIPYANIKILSLVLDFEISKVTEIIRQCIDNNLVLLDDGFYKIAPPITNAIGRLFGSYSTKDYANTAKKLLEEYWDNRQIPDLKILDVIITTLLRADLDQELKKFRNITMPSLILRAARDLYKSREWKLSEKLSRKTLMIDNSLDEARILLFKSIIRQETNDNTDRDLDKILELLEEHKNKSVYYLRGFRELKRKEYDRAIKYYKDAKLSGDNSIPVYRELAECYYWKNNIPNAKKEISIILDKNEVHNAFILDLAAKIAIADKDFEKADEYIEKQKLVDKYENVEHRMATYFLAQDNYLMARVHADNACNGKYLLPQMFLLRIKINIILGFYPEAEQDIEYIKSAFKYYSKDLLYVLQGRLILNKEGWEKAEIAFNNIRNKESNSAKGLKVLILSKKVQDESIPLFKRKDIENEISYLKKSKAYDIFENLQLFERQIADDFIDLTEY